MSDGPAAPRSVAAALEEVGKWRTQVAARNRSEIAEVDQEIENLRTALANLQQQIDSLRRSREDIAKREDVLGAEEVSRSYNAVFAALIEQSKTLTERAKAAQALELARNMAIDKALADPAIAATVAEYSAFKSSVAPTLAALPEALRAAISAVHEANTKKIRDHVAAAGGSGGELNLPALAVDVVYAVDAPEGAPEVVMLVLPVVEAAHHDWANRGEDLHTRVAIRVSQGVQAALVACGLTAVPAYGGHQGLLAMEIDVVGAKGDIAARLHEELVRALGTASELSSARVEIRPRAVPVEHILPPEEG